MNSSLTATTPVTSEPVDSTPDLLKIHSAAVVFDHWSSTTGRHHRTDDERNDDLMVRFFVLWVPFGGGDEVDIMMQFGIDRHQFSARLRELSLSPRICRYPDVIKKMLLEEYEPSARR